MANVSGIMSSDISRRNPQDEYELIQRIGSGTYGDVYKVIIRFSTLFYFKFSRVGVRFLIPKMYLQLGFLPLLIGNFTTTLFKIKTSHEKINCN